MRKDGPRAYRRAQADAWPRWGRSRCARTGESVFRADGALRARRAGSRGHAELVADYAMPVSADALRALTGLVNMRWQDMDAWSQGMIDGIANYGGDPAVEAALAMRPQRASTPASTSGSALRAQPTAACCR